MLNGGIGGIGLHVSIPYGAIRWFYPEVYRDALVPNYVSIPYGAIRWFYLSQVGTGFLRLPRFNPLRGNPVVLLSHKLTSNFQNRVFQSPTGQSGGSTTHRPPTRLLAIRFNPLRGNPVVLPLGRGMNKGQHDVSIPYGAIRWFYSPSPRLSRASCSVSIPYGAIRWFYMGALRYR